MLRDALDAAAARLGRPHPRRSALAARAGRGEDLLPDLDTGSNVIKKDKTGPLETEYFQNTTDARERFVAVDSLLAPYFGLSGGGNSIKLVRG